MFYTHAHVQQRSGIYSKLKKLGNIESNSACEITAAEKGHAALTNKVPLTIRESRVHTYIIINAEITMMIINMI